MFKVRIHQDLSRAEPIWSAKYGSLVRPSFEITKDIELPFPPFVGLDVEIPVPSDPDDRWTMKIKHVTWDGQDQRFICVAPEQLYEWGNGWGEVKKDADSFKADGFEVDERSINGE